MNSWVGRGRGPWEIVLPPQLKNILEETLYICICVCVCIYIYIYIYIHYIYTILPKVLGHPLLMNRFDYFSNFQEYKS